MPIPWFWTQPCSCFCPIDDGRHGTRTGLEVCLSCWVALLILCAARRWTCNNQPAVPRIMRVLWLWSPSWLTDQLSPALNSCPWLTWDVWKKKNTYFISQKFCGFCYTEKNYSKKTPKNKKTQKVSGFFLWSIPNSYPPLQSINVLSYINRLSVKPSYISWNKYNSAAL